MNQRLKRVTNFPFINQSRYRLLFVFLFLFLSACGTSSNGVGGTGITQGRVTGFGSMFVNGVKFNTDNAIFKRDGISSKKQEDFNTGEIVSIKGIVEIGRKTGVATEVIFSNLLEGTVTSIPTKDSVEILGQNVTTNNLTVFHGFNKLSELKIGNIVEISGFNSQNKITASSIQLIDSSFSIGSTLEVEGDISSLNKDLLTFKINNLIIDYSNAEFSGISENDIENGDYLIISSDQNTENNVFQATRVARSNNALDSNTYYEIEGFITDFNSTSNFTLDNDSPVKSNSNTIISNGSIDDLKLDQFLIVIGTTNSDGVLIAEEIRIIDSSDTLSIEANIESIDLSINSLVVLGQTITIDNFTLISDDTTEDFVSINLSDFAIADSVFIDIYLNNGGYTANRLSKIPSIPSEFIIGVIDSINSELGQLSIFNNTVSTDSETLFTDSDANTISAATFFSLLEIGISEVVITANYFGSEELLATELTIDN